MSREEDDLCANLWPDPRAIPGFREFIVNFYWTCRKTGMEILHVIALGMGLEETYFDAIHTDAINQLRLLHYPPLEEKALQDGEKIRIAAHTDFDNLTMLFHDDCGGLEIEDLHNPGLFKPDLLSTVL